MFNSFFVADEKQECDDDNKSISYAFHIPLRQNSKEEDTEKIAEMKSL